MSEMSVEEFMSACIEYNKENNIKLEIKHPWECPAHVFAGMKNKSCHTVHSGTKHCPLCGEFVCSHCYSHNVSVVSRVTGYLSTVSDPFGSGWNKAKRTEFEQRKRENIR